MQYVNWLGGVLQGDFGLDYRSNEPIGSMLLDRLPVTLELTGLALLLSIVFAIPLGVIAAVRRGRVADKATQSVSLVGISIPEFWLGIMLILVFSLGLGLLPSSGFVPFRDDPVENIRHMILPSFTLAVGLAAVLIRITRTAMLDVLHEDYIRFTRAKGVGERTVIFAALRNASIPIVTVVGRSAAICSAARSSSSRCSRSRRRPSRARFRAPAQLPRRPGVGADGRPDVRAHEPGGRPPVRGPNPKLRTSAQ